MARHGLWCLLVIGMAGCGGSSPAAPSPGGGPVGQAVPQFSTGRYLLRMTAFDLSSDPLVPACPGSFGVPRAGKSVVVHLTVVREGVEWVGRTSGAAADLELRFRDAGELEFGRRALAGTIRGQAPDMGLPGLLDPGDVSVTVAGTAATGALLDAQTAFSFAVNTLVGRAVGEFRFQDSAGNAATCSVVSIHINAPN
jgi:hypothetical protein